MTGTDPPTVAELNFRYSEIYRSKVLKKADPDQWIEVSAKVGDEDVYGGSQNIVTGHACWVVLKLLDSIEALHRNEQSIVEFAYGPSWLAVRSIDTATAEIAACHTLKGAKNPDKRLDVAREYYVTKDAWRDAVLEVTTEFYDSVTEISSDLSDHDMMLEIRLKRQEVDTIDF